MNSIIDAIKAELSISDVSKPESSKTATDIINLPTNALKEPEVAPVTPVSASITNESWRGGIKEVPKTVHNGKSIAAKQERERRSDKKKVTNP